MFVIIFDVEFLFLGFILSDIAIRTDEKPELGLSFLCVVWTLCSFFILGGKLVGERISIHLKKRFYGNIPQSISFYLSVNGVGS